MAANHVQLNRNLNAAADLLSAIRQCRVAFDSLRAAQKAQVQMLSGESSTADSYQKIADVYGVAADDSEDATKRANAKRMFDELNSATGNSAALEQFLAIMGGGVV